MDIDNFINLFSETNKNAWSNEVKIGKDRSLLNRIFVDPEGDIYVRETFNVKWIKTKLNVGEKLEIRRDTKDNKIMIIDSDWNGVGLDGLFLYEYVNGKELFLSNMFVAQVPAEENDTSVSAVDEWIDKFKEYAEAYEFQDCSVGFDIRDNDRITIHDDYIYIRENNSLKRTKTNVKADEIIEVLCDDNEKSIYLLCKNYNGFKIDKIEIYYLIGGELSGDGSVVDHFGNTQNTKEIISSSRWISSLEMKYKNSFELFMESNYENICDAYDLLKAMEIKGFKDEAVDCSWIREGNYANLLMYERIHKTYTLLRDTGIDSNILESSLLVDWDVYTRPFEWTVRKLLPYRCNLKAFSERAAQSFEWDEDFINDFFMRD